MCVCVCVCACACVRAWIETGPVALAHVHPGSLLSEGTRAGEDAGRGSRARRRGGPGLGLGDGWSGTCSVDRQTETGRDEGGETKLEERRG